MPNDTEQYIVVGLGNPGSRYEKTRHNAGRIVLDAMLEQAAWREDPYIKGEVSTGALKEVPIMYVKPNTFMNNSGESVRVLVGKYELSEENLIVVHDEVHLPFGALRISYARSAGGHNGVQSVIDALGTNKFVRIRIGVGPTDFDISGDNLRSYVLGSFNHDEYRQIKAMAPDVREATATIITDGWQRAANDFNTSPARN